MAPDHPEEVAMLSFRYRCQMLIAVLLVLGAVVAQARNPIRRSFFENAYPATAGSVLDNLPSSSGHCGLCHYAFGGGGARNPYGLAIQDGLAGGLNNLQAILAAGPLDSDGDGYTSTVEITDTINYPNTPTFPGYSDANVHLVTGVNPADLIGTLTPATDVDNDPPVVVVTRPTGGEAFAPNSIETVSWTAADASGIALVEIYLSDDGGLTWKMAAANLSATGSFAWFVPNLPGAANRIRVEALDLAGNTGYGDSPANFTILPFAGGVAPTTLRDFELAGTQPFIGGILTDPQDACASCHGGYDNEVEHWFNWRGSMMGNTMRDPLFLATMVIAEQDAPASGDLCLRCHTPGGWQEGRSTDTSGGMITAKDRWGVQCDYCHRLVDPIYQEGTSPVEDLPILAALGAPVLDYGDGQFVTDPNPIRRGPYGDVNASHQWLESPFHRAANLCGTCHDVSNPVFVAGGHPGEYVVYDVNTPHPDGDKRNMFPVERTFSEWAISEYATVGVYAPQFAGSNPDGMVYTCQDCHMAAAVGRGASEGPVRQDLGVHDLTGGNHFVPDLIPQFFPGEYDAAALVAGKARAVSMLQRAATVEIAETSAGGERAVTIKVTNETGHKLPSGYPEGRRIWLNLRGYDGGGSLIYESGAYDPATGVLTHDEDLKIYHIKPGSSTRLAALLDIDAGPSFHFVLNDTIFFDNRIPPRGATLAMLEQIQSPVVGYDGYQDGQYWDDTRYGLPAETASVTATLYYQSTSKEYIEFLRDVNTTNTLGQELYDAWVGQGRAAPVAMATVELELGATDVASLPAWRTSLARAVPNPFNPTTVLRFTLAKDGPVALRVYDQRGRLVRRLVDERLIAGEHTAAWDGRDGEGRALAAGVYLVELRAGGERQMQKLTLVK
jgi:cytochrome c553